MPTRLVIVGGVAGGATAAARARRLSESAEIIVLERGEHISFANCGLPYYVGGEIPQRQSLLVQTKAGLSRRFNLDIRTRHTALSIDRAARTLRVRDLEGGREYDQPYDFLLLSPGAEPIRPPLPGSDHPRIHTLRNMADADRLKASVDAGATQTLVIGGGFIGLELAENFRRRRLQVALVELLPQVLPPLDPEMAAPIQEELLGAGVQLHLADAVTAFEDDGGRIRARLKSGQTITADLVALAVGVRPESGLARAAGLELDARGAIIVDDTMRTSDPAIYAVGDAVQVRDVVFGGPAFVPLAGPANRQARIAVDNIFGRPARFRGVQGTSIVRVFELTVASTGASEKVLRGRGTPYRKVYVTPPHHVGYFPGAQPLLIKVLFTPDDGRLLGAQIVGGDGVDKRIDVLSVALQAGLKVTDLEQVELAYAPQYGAAKDPLNIAGFVATNLLRGDDEFLYWEQLDEATRRDWTIVDVRDPGEVAAFRVPGTLALPLSELRERWREIPRDKPIAVHCAGGQRSYYACRFLRHMGVACKNLAGGIRLYRYVEASRAPAR
jgi:NADPH-dependent 2,4-dienoyl-CoA reductase/sulfur reductase-like enzyme/rhodanese-related sulfurtransferase